MVKEDALKLYDNEVSPQLFIVAVQEYLKELVDTHPKFKDLPVKEVNFNKTAQYVQQAPFMGISQQYILKRVREFYRVKFNIRILTNKQNEIIKVY